MEGGRARNQVEYQACGTIVLILNRIYLYTIVKTKEWIGLKDLVDSEVLVFEVDTVWKEQADNIKKSEICEANMKLVK